MNDQYSLNNIDGLLFQFVSRVEAAERRSFIEDIHRNIKTLEGQIRLKQSTLIHNKEYAKSMKATKSLLLQYEQTLRAELESRKASYNHDL
ncbi:hypothetical protein EYF80_005153 [Liparis tanakae]|uniref:Uncharacterized protein n=1 Tax=Liparis tanakae TaxID=230148 RepID=A0A4Z2J4N3_9TELE|nr:hypothetical protein EYF80_005153 [Liparis tanakae]